MLAIRAFISDNKERINFIFSRYCGLVDEKSIAETSVDNDIECVKRFLTELSESIVAGKGKAIFGSFPQLALTNLIAEEIDENRGWSTISKSREMTTQILREITGVSPNVIFEDGSDERCPHPTMLLHLKTENWRKYTPIATETFLFPWKARISTKFPTNSACANYVPILRES